jgi:hypothetical protein
MSLSIIIAVGIALSIIFHFIGVYAGAKKTVWLVIFLMWAGLGLDALSVQKVELRFRLEKFFAVPEYAATTLLASARWRGISLRIWADGEEIKGHYIIQISIQIISGYRICRRCCHSNCKVGSIGRHHITER